MAKMSSKWVILCSTAVASVYTAGYFTTETQAPALQPLQYTMSMPSEPMPSDHSQTGSLQQTTGAAGTPQPTNSTQPTGTSQPTPSAQPTNTPEPADPPAAVNSIYKDGTYTGTGMNRRGAIQVAVTIKKDKITDVEISYFGMHYPQSDIDGLPDEVLQNQTAQVQNVSGATFSTRAFEDAVQDALYQAQNA